MSQNLEENFVHIPQLWDQAARSGLLNRLVEMIEGPVPGILGVCDCVSEQGPWRYYIAAATSAQPEDLERYFIPANTWAVFPGRGGSQAIQQLEQRIITEWMPTSGYEYAQGPDIEVYHSADPAEMVFEIWIPVRPIQQ